MTQGWFRVLENKELSPGNYRLVFEAPTIARSAKPGQFVQIGVQGCLLKRPFSICDVIGKNVAVLYKVVGKATTGMGNLKKGEQIDVIGPLGRPFEKSPKMARRIYVGGGVGVPPLYFLAKANPHNGSEDSVFIGARTKAELLCVADFKKLHLNVQVATEDGSAGLKGFVSVPLAAALSHIPDDKKKKSVVFTCGPKAMMKAVAELCAGSRVRCIASLEEAMGCGIGVCMGCVVKVRQEDGDFLYKRVCTDGPVMETDTILWD